MLFDEALALPTPKSARLALRTQQVLAYETDVTKTVDPFAGSYVVESLTDDLEAAIGTLMSGRRGPGRSGCGDRAGIPEGRDRAVGLPDRARRSTRGERVVVGVNRYAMADGGARTSRCGSIPAIEAGAVPSAWPGSGPSATARQ